MSLYYLQKFLYELNRDESMQATFRKNPGDVLDKYELTPEERGAVEDGDIGLLYVLGVNGQILMHYAAFLGVEWFDYLDKMRAGVERFGPVRAGIYAMTGGGDSFTPEGAASDKGSRK
jgi:hypothetical protein